MSKKRHLNNQIALVPIPDKHYFTIGEVAKLCQLKTHVLRYWEQEFIQLNPLKRRGNRRYYQVEDVRLVRRIRELLYQRGFTIEGAKQQIAAGRKNIKNQSEESKLDAHENNGENYFLEGASMNGGLEKAKLTDIIVDLEKLSTILERG